MKKHIALSLCAATILFGDDYALNLNQANEGELRATTPTDIYSGNALQKNQTLSGFLSEQTSITVVPSYGNVFSPAIDMRGFGTENGYQDTAIILNGQKLNNFFSSPANLISIPEPLLQRIQIERGGGSVEYGDNAAAGSIVLATKQIKGINAGASLGDFNQGSTYAGVGHQIGFLKATLYADFFNAPAEQHFGTNGMNNSSSKNLWFLAQTEMVGNFTFRFQKNINQQYNRYTSSMTTAQFYNNPSQSGSWQTAQTLFYNNTGGGLTYFGGHFAIDLDMWSNSQTNVYLPNSTSSYATNQMSLKAKAFANGFDVLLGAEGANSGMYNTIYGISGQQITTKNGKDIYAKAKYGTGNNSFNLGLRSSWTNYGIGLFSQNTNDYLWAGEAGYNYAFNNVLSAFVSYNRSFVTPNLNQFYAFNSQTYAQVFNGVIKPQTANTYNLGSIWINGKNNVKTTVFYMGLENEFYYQPSTATNPIGYNSNIPKSQKIGAELSGKYYILENLNALASLSLIRPTITSGQYNGNVVPGVSPFSGSFGIGYKPISDISIDLTEKYQSSTYAYGDFANAYPGTQKQYTSTDARVAYAMKNAELYAKAINIFGAKNGTWSSPTSVYPTNIDPLVSFGVNVKY